MVPPRLPVPDQRVPSSPLARNGRRPSWTDRSCPDGARSAGAVLLAAEQSRGVSKRGLRRRRATGGRPGAHSNGERWRSRRARRQAHPEGGSLRRCEIPTSRSTFTRGCRRWRSVPGSSQVAGRRWCRWLGWRRAVPRRQRAGRCGSRVRSRPAARHRQASRIAVGWEVGCRGSREHHSSAPDRPRRPVRVSSGCQADPWRTYSFGQPRGDRAAHAVDGQSTGGRLGVNGRVVHRSSTTPHPARLPEEGRAGHRRAEAGLLPGPPPIAGRRAALL